MKSILITGALLTAFVTASASSQATAKTKKPDASALQLSVKNNGASLLITNKSDEPYHAMTIRLVVGLDFNSYVAPLKDLGPGKTIRINLRDVTTSGGVRFNPVKYKPLIIIEGKHKDGRSGTWGAK